MIHTRQDVSRTNVAALLQRRDSAPTRRQVAAILIGSLLLGAGWVALSIAPTEAFSCDPGSPRAVVSGADAAVIARFLSHVETRSPDVVRDRAGRRVRGEGAGQGDRSTDRYVVEEWLKGDGPDEIVVTVDADRMRRDEAMGLALEHVRGRRYESGICIPVYPPEVVRLAAAPEEVPSGEGPPALFVGTEFAAGDRGSSGAWLDRRGRLLAWDEIFTTALTVCPGGRLAVQAGWKPGYDSQELRVRDLETLEVVEDFPLERSAEAVLCRDESATDILLADSEGIFDARSGQDLVRRTYEVSPLLFGRDLALGREGEGGLDLPYALEIVDLETGTIRDLLDPADGSIRDYALDPSGERAAILVHDDPSGEDSVIVKRLSAPHVDDMLADLRITNLISGPAPAFDVVTDGGEVLVSGLERLEPAHLRLPRGSIDLELRAVEREGVVIEVEPPVDGAGDVLVDLEPLTLEAGGHYSIFILGSVTGVADVGPPATTIITLRLDSVTTTDLIATADPERYAVRVLNATEKPVEAQIGRGKDSQLIGAVAPRALSDYVELESRRSRNIDLVLRDTDGSRLHRGKLRHPDTGEGLTLVITPPEGGGRFTIVGLADAPPPPLAGEELARRTMASSPKQPAYVVWVDADHIAHVRTQKPKDDDSARGRVTLLDASDLHAVCEWRGWNVEPAGAADGVLLGHDGPYRVVGAHATNGGVALVRDLDKRADVYDSPPTVPLPAFDGAALLGEPVACLPPEAAADDGAVEGPGTDAEASTASRRELEDELLARVAPIECRRWRKDDDPFDFGARAAIQCGEPAPRVAQLALFTFSDAASLDTFWQRRIDRLEPRPPKTDSACGDGSQGITGWEHGQIACYTQGRVAKIRWTDEGTDTYGVLDATDRDLAGLYAWWSSNEPSADLFEPTDDPVALAPGIPTTQGEQIAYLLARAADPDRCKPMMPRGVTSAVPGALAGIACTPTRQEREDDVLHALDYYLFPTRSAMDAWWARTLVEVPRVNDQGEEMPGEGLEPDSGSLQACHSYSASRAGETGWVSEDGMLAGRVACWQPPRLTRSGRQGLTWTVTEALIGTSAVAAPEWFSRAHPERIQAYPSLEPGVAPHPSFADPDAMKKLPRGVGKEPKGRDTDRFRPTSARGLRVGVVFPRIQGHCDKVGSAIDIDGSWWDAVAGIDPSGKAITDVRYYDEEEDRRTPISEDFWEYTRVEFLKITDDTAQLRTPNGWVIAYERHKGARRFYGCA